jgi:hypothetical protein
MNELIRVYQNIIPANICDEIITKFDSDPGRFKGVVGSPDFGGGVRTDVKTSTDLQISKLANTDPSWKRYVDILGNAYMAAIKKYAEDVSSMRYLVGQMGITGFQIQCYPPDEGHYTEHVDANSTMASLRVLSGVIYLNTVENGGETSFPYQDKKIKPVQGSIAIFPSNFAFPHEALNPIGKPKYIAATWLSFSVRQFIKQANELTLDN